MHLALHFLPIIHSRPAHKICTAKNKFRRILKYFIPFDMEWWQKCHFIVDAERNRRWTEGERARENERATVAKRAGRTQQIKIKSNKTKQKPPGEQRKKCIKL